MKMVAWPEMFQHHADRQTSRDSDGITPSCQGAEGSPPSRDSLPHRSVRSLAFVWRHIIVASRKRSERPAEAPRPKSADQHQSQKDRAAGDVHFRHGMHDHDEDDEAGPGHRHRTAVAADQRRNGTGDEPKEVLDPTAIITGDGENHGADDRNENSRALSGARGKVTSRLRSAGGKAAKGRRQTRRRHSSRNAGPPRRG